jgi:gliding motility-associated lipoprotein GldD
MATTIMNFKLLVLAVILLPLSCTEKYTPKPRGFFRISFPEKIYHPLDNRFPYQFEIPQYSQVTSDTQNPDQPWWINIEVPGNKAEVHISYYNLNKQKKAARELLAAFMEESRDLAYKHSIKANAIEEQIFVNPGQKVFGTVYRIEGNAASPVQFFLTDSTHHFLRGALYIRATPDIDSLKPVIDFLERDVIRLIETTKWE